MIKCSILASDSHWPWCYVLLLLWQLHVNAWLKRRVPASAAAARDFASVKAAKSWAKGLFECFSEIIKTWLGLSFIAPLRNRFACRARSGTVHALSHWNYSIFLSLLVFPPHWIYLINICQFCAQSWKKKSPKNQTGAEIKFNSKSGARPEMLFVQHKNPSVLCVEPFSKMVLSETAQAHFRKWSTLKEHSKNLFIVSRKKNKNWMYSCKK